MKPGAQGLETLKGLEFPIYLKKPEKTFQLELMADRSGIFPSRLLEDEVTSSIVSR